MISERGAGGGGGGEGAGGGGLTDMSKRKMCGDIKEAAVQDGHLSSDQLLFIRASIEINSARKDAEKLWYPACKSQRNSRACMKKLTDGGGGQWTCGECGHQDRPECASGGGERAAPPAHADAPPLAPSPPDPLLSPVRPRRPLHFECAAL